MVNQTLMPRGGNWASQRPLFFRKKARLGDVAGRVPTRQLPNWMVGQAARLDASIAQIVPELGKVKHATNEKARRVLGWVPRSN